MIARISPVMTPVSAGFPISQLDDLLAKFALPADERARPLNFKIYAGLQLEALDAA